MSKHYIKGFVILVVLDVPHGLWHHNVFFWHDCPWVGNKYVKVDIIKLITEKIVPFGSSVTALIISNLYFSVQATPKIVPL